MEEPCNSVRLLFLQFIARSFSIQCKKSKNCQNLEFFFFASIWLQFSKILKNLKKQTILYDKATLPLWFEPSHNYVGSAVTEIIYGLEGLIRAVFSAVGLFLGRKSKIFHEQNVKEFQFYIRIPNYRLLGSILKKKYPKVANLLKPFYGWI